MSTPRRETDRPELTDVAEGAAVNLTATDYPTPFTSAVWRENVFATQFHPEKSQSVGLTRLRNFAALR